MRLLLFTLQLLISTSLLALPEFNSLNAYEHNEGLLAYNHYEISTLNVEAPYTNAPEVSWSSVPGAHAYMVEVTENGSTVLLSTVYGTTKTLNGLIPGHTYHCTVSSIINGKQSTNFIIAMDIMP